MSENLLPCPFCGKTAEYFDHPPQVYCKSCNISIEGECKESAIEIWNTRPATPLVGVDEKLTYNEFFHIIEKIIDTHIKYFVKENCPMNQAEGIYHETCIKEGYQAILTKFGSPQKESGDLEKVLEEFDKKFQGWNADTFPAIKKFIRLHWPKPDPRFVEVGEIEWPDEYDVEIASEEVDSEELVRMRSWNSAIDACRAAVEAVEVEYGLDEEKMAKFIQRAGAEWELIEDPISPLYFYISHALKLADRELIVRTTP